MNTYFAAARQYPILTSAQAAECVARYDASKDARDLHPLVCSNLRLVLKCAHAFKGYSAARFEDLVQAGNLGLLHGVTKFRPEKGFAATTYLVWWIRAAMWKEVLSASSLVKFGTTNRDKLNFTRLKRRKLGQDDESFAAELGISLQELEAGDARLRALTVVSLDCSYRPGDDGAPEPWLDALPSADLGAEALCAQGEAEHAVTIALEQLTPRQRFIVGKRFWHDETLQSVADALGVSRERVRQVQSQALETMRAAL